MSNFYRGGRELSIEKDSSCSPKIKLKTIRVQSPELLANFKWYFTRIFQVLVKYYLSTDIVLFTQQLTSQINKGKTYYKSTRLVLQKYLNGNGNLPAVKWEQSDLKRETSSDCLMTNFTPTSAFLRASLWSCIGRPSDFPEANQSPTRSRLDENPINGRSWSGVGRVLLLLTALVFQYLYFSFKALKNIRAFILLALMCFNNIICSLMALKNTTMLLTCIAVFHMFSLSAQTPRKDSGADGQNDLKRFPKIRYDVSDIEIQKLHIGDSLPASFWETPIWLVYPDGKDEKKKLESFRDRKILVFDFWATWCAPCIASIDKFHQEAAVFDKRVAFIPVHIDFDYKALPFIQQRKWKSPCMIGKSGMLIQKYFFDQATAGGVVWIVDGIVRSIGYENEQNIKSIPDLLGGKEVELTTYYK